MDHIDSRQCDLDVDLESGETTSEEEGGKKHGFLPGQISSCSRNQLNNTYELSLKFTEEIASSKEKPEKEKRKKPKSVKPPKPPLPPKGPSLDAADMKLVKEISDIAFWKRKRIERVKALKKMRKERVTSSSNNCFAMVVTVLFLLVIIFQGHLGSLV